MDFVFKFFSSVIIWDYFYPLLVLSSCLLENTLCRKMLVQSNLAAQTALEERMKKWNKNQKNNLTLFYC